MSKLTVEDILFMQDEVVRFNSIMGNSVTDKDLIETYRLLSLEETTGAGELIDSIIKDDKEGILDGLIDSVFVISFFANLQGYSLEQDKNWLQEKLDSDDPFDGDTLEEILELMVGNIKSDEGFGAQTHLCLLLSHFQDQFDIAGAFKEVLASNLSKFIVKGTTDIDVEMSYILQQGRYEQLSVHEVEVDGVVYQSIKALRDNQNDVTFSKPKLVKPRSFKEPELEQFVL